MVTFDKIKISIGGIMRYQNTAQQIAAAIQSAQVIAMTLVQQELRIVVKDAKQINVQTVDQIPGVVNADMTDEYLHIILENKNCTQVVNELIEITEAKSVTPAELEDITAQLHQKNPIMKLVNVLSDIFVPLIPALVAGGLLMALDNILTQAGIFGPQPLVEMFPQIKGMSEMIALMSGAPFMFLPILIGFTATKRFGGNEVLGAVAGAVLVMPQLVPGDKISEVMTSGHMPTWDLFGTHIAQTGYQGQVLPIIGVAFILATLEKFFHKHLKGALDFTFTPMLALLITGFITFTVVGPALRVASNGFTDALVWLVTTTGAVGYGIFGALYAPIVITGLHQTFPAIETQLLTNIAKTGGDFIFPIAAVSNLAQAGSAFGVFFLSKGNKDLRAVSSSAGTSALLGITEPAMFGVNLKYKFPFFIALCAAGVGGVVMGIFHMMSISMGPMSVLGFVAIAPSKWLDYFVGIGVAFFVALIVTVVYGKTRVRRFNE